MIDQKEDGEIHTDHSSEPVRDHLGRPVETIAPPPEDNLTKFIANLKTIGYALFLAMLIRIVLFENFLIEGPSMMPTLLDGDRVVVSKFLYGLSLPFMSTALVNWGIPNAGDIIIVISPEENEDAIVKRVIGVPGDTIEVREDVVYRNGESIFVRNAGPCHYTYETEEENFNCELVEERIGDTTYRTSHDAFTPPSDHEPVVVPDGHIYVLGDHRDRSQDSRRVGVIPVTRIKGRALAAYWSSSPRVDNGSPVLSTVRWSRLFKAIR